MNDDNVDGGDDDVDGGDDDVDGAVEDVDEGVEDQVGVKLRGEGQDNLVPGCQVVGICHPNLMVVSSSTSSPSSYHIILIFFTATNMFTDQEPCSRVCYSWTQLQCWLRSDQSRILASLAIGFHGCTCHDMTILESIFWELLKIII